MRLAAHSIEQCAFLQQEGNVTAMDEPTVGQDGEFAVLRRVAQHGDPAGGPLVGPGDDAAVLGRPYGSVVACTDMLVEGRHFRLDWSAPADAGHKAIAQNAADIAAMGAECTGFLLAVGCPATTAARVIDELAAGARQEAEMLGAGVIGGDLVQSPQIVVTVTALGDTSGVTPVLRSGAGPGDTVALAGSLGGSMAGFELLRTGWTGSADRADSGRGPAGRAPADVFDRLVGAHRRPAPPYAAGPAAAWAGATAMIDVSDGLVADAGHIAEASSVVIDLDPAAFALDPADAADTAETSDAAAGPCAPGLRAAADALDADMRGWIFGGGEDHALVATFPPGVGLPEGWHRIGTVRPVASAGRPRVLVGGVRWPDASGWSAFDR